MTDDTASEMNEAPKKRSIWMSFLPVILFVGLAGLFFYQLSNGDPSTLPSVLIDKPAPDFDLPAIAGLKRDGQPVPGLSSADLKKGKVHVVNVWATWCTACRTEHPVLEKFARMNIAPLVGIDYKDKPEKVVRYLRQYGNPFAAVGDDAKGRTGIDFGVYGVPETYVIDGKGIIRYKHIGPIMPADLESKIIPAIKKARGEK
ncbi:MAG TPA: DsbE family thiol:disulfide interchange protein [Rhizobiales bacterium]|nr:DsbE family thiol:disulfide interchange protein [Hyphomicrobiales bacterium]